MGPSRGGGGASTLSIDLMTKIMTWAATVLKFAAILFVASTAYILYGVYGGHLAHAVDARILANLQLMGQIMAASGAVGAICLVILTHEEIAYCVVVGIVGVGYLLGLPLMVAGQVSSQAAQAGQIITRWSSATGQAILVIVGIRVLMEIARFIQEAPNRRARLEEQEGVERPKAGKAKRVPWYRLARCWEMPFCHEAIMEMCPAFKARKSCWRLRQGCNCDPYLIEALLRKGAGKEISMQDAAYLRTDLVEGRKTSSHRTRECRNCPIFIEHQRQKFRVLNPLLIIATIIALLAAYPIMRGLYTTFIRTVATLANHLAYGSQVPVGDWVMALDSPTVWIFFYIIVGLLVMSYVLKAIEWAILVRKIL